MRKIFAASALAVMLALTGCASVDSGKVIDKVQQAGTQEYDCDSKTTGTGKNKKTTKVCGFEQRPDVCRFWLEDTSGERGWLEVDCATTFTEYERGEQYPRD